MPSPSKPPGAAASAPRRDRRVRLLRILLWLLLLLIVALPLAAWLVPPRLDLDKYRSTIAGAAAERLGRSVTIGGQVALRLLPEPALTATKIAIGSGESVSITARELSLRVALGPLLEGRIDARELVLRGADMRLPWPLDPSQLMVRTPYWLSALSAVVEDGRLSIGGLTFTGIDATLTTSGYGGTYAAAGTAQFSGQPWHFAGRLTQPGGDGSAGLDIALDGQGPMQGIGATLSGQIASDGSLAGQVGGRGPDLSRLIPAPAVPFKADGRVTIAGGLAAADDLAMQIGGSPARGAVALRVAPMPRLDLALAASRLDLDAWLPVLAHPGALPLPAGIDLSAEAASFAGGTLRGLRAAVDLSSAGADVREVRAVLPGEASLRLEGKVTPEAGTPPHAKFEGDATVSAPALRTTLAWLEQAGVAPFASLPGGVLRSAVLGAHVVAEPGQFAATALDGTVDSSRLGGSVSLRAGKRFSIGAGLTVDRLELDPWLPASLPPLPSLAGRFGAFDVDLRLEAKQALFEGNTIETLSLDAGEEAGRLTLRKLDFQLGGVHANGSATVGDGGRVNDAHLDLQAAQASSLAGLLPARLGFMATRAPLFWSAPAMAQMQASGPADNIAMKVTAELGDLRLEMQPVLNTAKHSWTAAVQLRHPGAPRLMEALGLPGGGAWLGEGSLSMVGQVSGSADRYAADSFDLTAGGLRAGGALQLSHLDARPALTGHIDAESLPLPLPGAHDLDPLPLAALSGWDGTVKIAAQSVRDGLAPLTGPASATVSLTNGVLRIEDLIAQLSGGAVSLQAELDTAAAPPALHVNLGMAGVALTGPLLDWPAEITAGTLDAGAELMATGYAPVTLLATLAGTAHAEVQNGTLAGLALEKLTGEPAGDAAAAALAGGSTTFKKFAAVAQIASGVATLTSGSLSGPAGSAEISGSLNLPASMVGLHVALHPALPAPPGLGLRLTGPLDNPVVTPELAGLIGWQASRAAAAPANP